MNHKYARSILAPLLALCLCLGMFPTAFAAQANGYRDPAEHWVRSSNRTNELDANAVTTRETFFCGICHMNTSFLVFRTPEYTRDGVSAATRNVFFSDGTSLDGETTGHLNDGVPGVNATYTGYHWTKAVCETCGSINSNASAAYAHGKNLYLLADCATSFMRDLEKTTTYEYADSQRHTKTTKGGEYCAFCFGTNHTEASVLERHRMAGEVTAEAGNHRFKEVQRCADCGYAHNGYLAAKAVVTNYYGMADNKPHTLTVADLSDAGVSTAIRYGTSANHCTLTSAPNYTEAGEYTVYYEITYTYGGQSMKENGVAYVQLRPQDPADPPADLLGCADHKYALVSTVPATCTTLGYSRYLCTTCGAAENRDYTAALGHNWQDMTIREASCGVPGKVAHICTRCGEVSTVETAVADHAAHQYIATTTPATCTTGGRTTYRCTFCGDSYTDAYTEPLGHTWNWGTVITAPTCTADGIKEHRCARCHVTTLESIPATGHDYDETVTPATCQTEGIISRRCKNCGDSSTTSFMAPMGHDWDAGTPITTATCTGEGVIEHKCTRCDASYLEAQSAAGHTPGAATCTQPQVCTVCGAVLKKPTGHSYTAAVTKATCAAMGYTTHTCKLCGDSYKDSYTPTLEHKAGGWIVDREATSYREGQRHKACTLCGKTVETEAIPKLDATSPKSERHFAYIVGLPGGRAAPAGTMTRAETAAIFARLLAEKNNMRVIPTATWFSDIPADAWYSGYVCYLDLCGVVNGCPGGVFKPETPITRAEFVAMVARFYAAMGGETTAAQEKGGSVFWDVTGDYWASAYIWQAAEQGWVLGSGGVFRGGDHITRAEAVTLVNRLLGREADKNYIDSHPKALRYFTDLSRDHWAYYDIMEAAIGHTATVDAKGKERWEK